jgi:hypothetical protein
VNVPDNFPPVRAHTGKAVTYSAWRLCFEATMTKPNLPRVERKPDQGAGFKLVCETCDGLGIVLDCPENAPSLTLIKCGQCGALRGTLGDLRNLSSSDGRDLFEFYCAEFTPPSARLGADAVPT